MEFFLCLAIPLAAGFVVSLLVFIPPIKIFAQYSHTFKLILVFTLGLVSFFFIYGLLTHILALETYHSGDWQYECQSCDHMVYVPPEFTQEKKEHEKAIIIEYWSRELLPPVFQSSCNTKHPTVCRLADDISARKANTYISPEDADQIQRNAFLHRFAFSSIATISTLFFVHLFTRKEEVHKRIPLF
jgi:hypothetical protein